MNTPTMRLGDLLVRKGLLAADQLAKVLEQQAASREFLGTILVRSGLLTEDQLLQTLAEQFGVKYIALTGEQVDWTVARKFPPALLKEHDCFPVRMDGQTVTVAITNPMDAWAISEVEHRAHPRRVAWVLAAKWDIQAAIRRSTQEALKSLDNLIKSDGDH